MFVCMCVYVWCVCVQITGVRSCKWRLKDNLLCYSGALYLVLWGQNLSFASTWKVAGIESSIK